jgi:hypothetical protein
MNSMREPVWVRMVKFEDVESSDTTTTLLTDSTGGRETEGRVRRNSEEAKCRLKVIAITLFG